jgi:hypothetical protein
MSNCWLVTFRAFFREVVISVFWVFGGRSYEKGVKRVTYFDKWLIPRVYLKEKPKKVWGFGRCGE